MAIAGKSAGAEKHDDPDDQKSEDRQKQKVSAFATHGADDYSFFLVDLAGIKSFWPIFNFRGSSM